MSYVQTHVLGAKNDLLARSLRSLQRALSADFPGRERHWAETVGDALMRAGKALRSNLDSARAHEGSLAEVDDTIPTLSRQADALCNEQEELLGQVVALQEEAHRAAEAFQMPPDPLRKINVGSVPNFGAIRQRGQQLLAGLQHTKETEAFLVLASVNTDIGVGD